LHVALTVARMTGKRIALGHGAEQLDLVRVHRQGEGDWRYLISCKEAPEEEPRAWRWPFERTSRLGW
jgi:hypothetical protein